MCLGIPMRIKVLLESSAQCEDRNGVQRQVGTLLLEGLNVGDWVLIHLDNAMRILDEAEAKQIADALQAVCAVMQGGEFEHLFADLIEREPQLPEAIRAQQEKQS